MKLFIPVLNRESSSYFFTLVLSLLNYVDPCNIQEITDIEKDNVSKRYEYHKP